MKLYAWISDPHEGEPEEYPMSFAHPTLGALAMFSTHKSLVTSEQMRQIAQLHAAENRCRVRLVEADVVSTIDIIEGAGVAQ